MKKFSLKKIAMMGLAAIMAVSAMSVSAFAADNGNDLSSTNASVDIQEDFGFEVFSEEDINDITRTPWMSRYVNVAINNGSDYSENQSSSFQAEVGDKYVYIRIASMPDNNSTINVSLTNIDDNQIKGHKMFLHKGEVIKYTIPSGLYKPSYVISASTNDPDNVGGAYLDVKTTSEELEADHII